MLCKVCSHNKVCSIGNSILHSNFRVVVSSCDEYQGSKLTSISNVSLSDRMERIKKVQKAQRAAEFKEECTMCHQLKPSSEIIKCTNCRRLICRDCANVDVDRGYLCDSCTDL